MTYSFTDEDKIMSPNTYFYTEFNGQEFLDEYFANRELIIELSKEALEPLFVISDTQIKESLIQTSVFLEKTYLSLQSHHHSPNAEVFSEVDMILKKFEVSKRIYDFYLPKFKKSDESDFRTFHNYLHFARILSVSYGITKKLNYLNGMLKVIDSLISVFNELSEKEKKNLAWLAEKELNHIRELTINLGIEE